MKSLLSKGTSIVETPFGCRSRIGGMISLELFESEISTDRHLLFFVCAQPWCSNEAIA